MRTLIIGGGMSGLTYGIMAVRNGEEAVICERNSRVGKKLSQTGNGKCNIGNVNVSDECFNESTLVRRVLDSVSVEDYIKFLNSCGIYTRRDMEGRLYPLSASASNVVDCLRYQFVKSGGILLTDTEITSVQPVDGVYKANLCGSVQTFNRVVLACGSGSATSAPNVGGIVDSRWLTPLSPSLVPVKIAGMDKSLNGLRAKACAMLFAGEKLSGVEFGEVQFKDYGLSGICILNLSAVIARNIVAGKNLTYDIALDLVPELTQWELEEIVKNRAGEPPETLFYGILHNKLSQYVLKCSNSAEHAARLAKRLTFRVDRLLDYSLSQVTAGGVSENFLTADFRLPNGVTVIGEALNVDGLCDGNNLFFAAASAIHLFDRQQRKVAFGL